MSNETSSIRSSSMRDIIAVLPTDTAASFLLAVAAGVIYHFPSLAGPHARTLVGLPLLLFAPGYTLLAVLYPVGTDRSTGVRRTAATEHWLDWPARLALSLGLSVALVPIIALAVSVVGGDLRTVPSVVAGLVAVGSVLGAVRRVKLPPNRRLRVPLPSLRRRNAPAGVRGARLAVASLLAFSVLAATATVGYALVVPSDGETYSSIYLATENETGSPAAGSFPTTFDGEARELVVGVENHEGKRTSYTVVVQLQRVETDGGNVTVLDRKPLRRFHVDLAPGESWTRTHEIAPTSTGEDLRLAYLLYRDPPGDTPATAEPYRRTYLWVDVTAPATDDRRGR